MVLLVLITVPRYAHAQLSEGADELLQTLQGLEEEEQRLLLEVYDKMYDCDELVDDKLLPTIKKLCVLNKNMTAEINAFNPQNYEDADYKASLVNVVTKSRSRIDEALKEFCLAYTVCRTTGGEIPFETPQQATQFLEIHKELSALNKIYELAYTDFATSLVPIHEALKALEDGTVQEANFNCHAIKTLIEGYNINGPEFVEEFNTLFDERYAKIEEQAARLSVSQLEFQYTLDLAALPEGLSTLPYIMELENDGPHLDPRVLYRDAIKPVMDDTAMKKRYKDNVKNAFINLTEGSKKLLKKLDCD